MLVSKVIAQLYTEIAAASNTKQSKAKMNNLVHNLDTVFSNSRLIVQINQEYTDYGMIKKIK